MLTFKGRRRIINVFLVISLLIFAVVIVVIIIREDEDMVPYQSDLLKNIVKMKEIDLLYVIDNNTYVKLKSKHGNVNIIDYNLDLINLDLLYTSKDFAIDAKASRGEYLSQRFLKVYDNITGHMDNMTFTTGPSGILEYDYTEGKGIVKNGVTIYQDNNAISSKIVEFDANNKLLGNVLYALAHCSVSPKFYINYTIKDKESAKKQLLNKAVMDSKIKAEILAEAAGVSLKDIQIIDYSWEELNFIASPMSKGGMALSICEVACKENNSYDFNIEPDNIVAEDTVTIIWNIL